MVSRVYGITPEQYQELLIKQNYCCAVCERHETEFARKLAIDHDHGTGEIFGLLCNECNHRVVGKVRDPNVFLKAAEYLKQGTGWIVPPKVSRKKKRVKRSRLEKDSR
jgi:5-methylcytosine-specific restriction endonuclease McrA